MNKIYYSTVNGGFYSDDPGAHGPRIVFVPDPDWNPAEDDPDGTAPLIEVVNKLCTLPPAGELIEITWGEHSALMKAQTEGKTIQKDKGGRPIAVAPPEPTQEQLAVAEAVWVGGQLSITEPMISRYRDERDLEEPTTLPAARFTELLGYRKALRAWSLSPGFPIVANRPPPPAWLEQLDQ